MAELIDDGATGFLVDDVDGAVRAVSQVGDLERAAIRSGTCESFGVATMVDKYVSVYRAVLADR
jgi:glycosyltransferase involved in cell wall biosynthesis